MTGWAAHSKFLRLALACAMVLSTLVAPPGPSASHDPAALAFAEVERHVALTAAEVDKGHSHEDGRPDERHPNHSHAHDPTDHTHEIPAPADPGGHAFPVFSQSWRAVAPPSHGDDSSFGIERPPRP
jgi:hypothetical protein